MGGGYFNRASGNGSIVGGGANNDASGSRSTVGGGSENEASNQFSTVGGGGNNTASGAYATVFGGNGAVASHYGEVASASGSFSEAGDAQASLYVLRRETSDSSWTELFLDGSAERITLAPDRVMTFDILIVGTTAFGFSYSTGYRVTGVIKNTGGVTGLVGTPNVTVLGYDAGAGAWTVGVEANDAFDALVVKVDGSSTMRWVASVRTVEVGR